ncbi:MULTISPECIES: hypothetical protein [Microcystis]|nr:MULTISPECIES: hypothetical protein [Microcystis]MCA2900877.1 hypothetical protein [Microcystis sp. M035S1]MCA2726711.1 hypothetical protein [Microcystis sp. M166S2]MCA2731554.1 hypothetical protein [Microcystis sp. M162S2]MCA2748376.1 hypothetical protein [Microcystis sp. M155S2]MCA2765595.1 hypothetical protein [Microcystis sp. M152S2]
MFQESSRLWQRYLINNPSFLLFFALQLLRDWEKYTVIQSSVLNYR